MKTLIIWEMIPEETNIYLIPEDIDTSEFDCCAGYFLNTCEATDANLDEKLSILLEALSDTKEWDDILNNELATKWNKYKVNRRGPIFIENNVKVIHTGFLM